MALDKKKENPEKHVVVVVAKKIYFKKFNFFLPFLPYILLFQPSNATNIGKRAAEEDEEKVQQETQLYFNTFFSPCCLLTRPAQ